MDSDKLLIGKALEIQQKGDLNAAAKVCRVLIRNDPKNVDALHLLGVILNQAGLNDEAIRVLEQALFVGGPDTSILHNYGVTQQDLGNFKKSAQAFRCAVEGDPLRTDTWFHLGKAELLGDNFERSVAAFECVLKQDPGNVEARNNLSIALRKLGRLKDARFHLRKNVNVDPKNPATQNNLGITETELNNFAAAKIAFKMALSIAPHYADAHYNIGNVYLAELDYQVAAEYYLQALDIAADHKPSLYHLALCRQKQNLYDEALGLINCLIAICEGDVTGTNQALGFRANIYRNLGQFDAALTDINSVLTLSPDNFAFYGNKALILQHAGRLEDAIKAYRNAVLINPENETVQSNLAQALLLAGHRKEGWEKFEARLTVPSMINKRDSLPGANWLGENLTGKDVLLWCEQGLGDTLQFMRFVALVSAQAEQVILRCPERLKRLLQSFDATLTLVGEDETLPDVDFNAPLMSLPHLLALDEIPNTGPYLSAEPDLITQWNQILGTRNKPRIGIAWQGNPSYEADHQRSLPLSYFEPLLELQHYEFISLQQGFGQDQLAGITGGVVEFSEGVDEIAAFIDSAAIMVHLDLVVTSDTALSHLAGALGVPVWVLLPETPDWRWLLQRSDSPWYSNMRLFRQTSLGNWEGVVDQVLVALAQEGFSL